MAFKPRSAQLIKIFFNSCLVLKKNKRKEKVIENGEKGKKSEHYHRVTVEQTDEYLG